MVTAKILLILTVFLYSGGASATNRSFLEGLSFPSENAELGPFVVPNEVNPELAQPIFDSLPHGAYISVGTERGFIGAALSKNVDYLIFLDRDPNVILFDEMNTELLRLSRSRSEYVHLRLEASFSEFQIKMSESRGDFKSLSQEKLFNWWAKSVRSAGFRDFNENPKSSVLAAYRNANYLFDDRLFYRLKKMADNGNIKSFVFNFSGANDHANLPGFTKLFQALLMDGIPLSIFDFSNVWYKKYLGESATDEIVRLMQDMHVGWPESVFMVTQAERFQYYSNGERSRAPLFSTVSQNQARNARNEYQWSYHGFTFGEMKDQPPNLEKLPNFSTLNGQRIDLITPRKPSFLECFIGLIKPELKSLEEL